MEKRAGPGQQRPEDCAMRRIDGDDPGPGVQQIPAYIQANRLAAGIQAKS
jgi:hypothetical protein